MPSLKQEYCTLLLYSHCIQALQKAGEHLLFVTKERSVYKQEVEESRRQVHKHFTKEGVFVPPPPHGVQAMPSLSKPSRGSLPQKDCHGGGGRASTIAGCVGSITDRQIMGSPLSDRTTCLTRSGSIAMRTSVILCAQILPLPLTTAPTESPKRHHRSGDECELLTFLPSLTLSLFISLLLFCLHYPTLFSFVCFA